MTDRLDFEFVDPLMDAPPPTKRRKRVIDLDDLLADHYKEKGKCIEGNSKKKKVLKYQNSDDEDEIKEIKLSKTLDQCHKQIKEIGGDEILHWGLRVFQDQKALPTLNFPELSNCSLLQSFNSSKLDSLVSISQEEGGNFLEGMLINGWLSKLTTQTCCVEKVIAEWTFNLMMYSESEHLRKAACDFWCDILVLINMEITKPIKVDWVPSWSDLRRALDIYGFTVTSLSGSEHGNSESHPDRNSIELSQNTRMWIKFMGASCLARNQLPMFIASEVEEFAEVIIYMFLDHQLDGLTVALCKCLMSAISYFSDEEWKVSCTKIAKSIASRVPKDINCLRVVECIWGADIRSKRLRSELAQQILSNCLDIEVSKEEEILNKLISINVKDKSCDLFKVYICLILTQNWVLQNPILEAEEKPVIHEMWGLYLRNCSCLIASTDLRPYASKVRNRASFILQGSMNE